MADKPPTPDNSILPSGRAYRAPDVTVYFDGSRCRHFAECVAGLPAVFDVNARPWIQPSNSSAEQVAEVIRRCPSGALHYQLTNGPAEHPDPTTTVTQIPGGALLLRGALQLQDADGGVRLSETRMAACSCGRTSNAPFCDGACHSEA